MNWLDPCCGGDTSNEASYISVIKQEFDPNEICGIDIREHSIRNDTAFAYLCYQVPEQESQ